MTFRRARPNLRVVVGDLATNDSASLAESRKLARPILRQWLRRIELDVMAGQLAPLDVLTAKELCNYPSANHGRCFAGQQRIAAAIGSCARTVRSSLKRLIDRGFLSSRRGGQGRTSTWLFCVNGRLIFGSDAFLPIKTTVAANSISSSLDRKDVAGLDRQHVADKPFEQTKPIEQNPPLSPIAEESNPVVLQGEILNDAMTFQEFWLASGRQGSEGYARSEWRKLSVQDVAAIADHFRFGSRRKRSSVWSGTWLRDRVWLEVRQESADVEHEVAPAPRFIHADVGSDLWRQASAARRSRLHGQADG
jgi:hypothetical protein